MSFKDVNSPVNFLSKESSNQVPIVRRDDFARRVFPITYYHLSMNDNDTCLLYTSPSPRDATLSRMPSSA